MTRSKRTPTTPITAKADRRDERVRTIEESVLLIRGEWPVVAAGLCESVNRAAGLLFPAPRALEEAIVQTAGESLRLVKHLYGSEAVTNVQQLAAVSRDAGPHRLDESHPRRRRIHLRRPPGRVQARTG
jgi:hypothetical protein